MYDTWVIDPQIGAVLTEFMSAETARSWIKDGPMKEYRRARHGAGRYARFGSGQGPSAAQIVAHAVGPGGVLVGDTLGVHTRGSGAAVRRAPAARIRPG